MSDIADLQKAVETGLAAHVHAKRLNHIVEEKLRDNRIEYGQLRQMLHALVMAEVGAAETPGNGPTAGFFNGVGGEERTIATAKEAVDDLMRGEEPEGETAPSGNSDEAAFSVDDLMRGEEPEGEAAPSGNSDEAAFSYATLSSPRLMRLSVPREIGD